MKSVKIKSLVKAVAVAGTAEPLSATQILVTDFEYQPLSANTGANMYIGDSTVSAATAIARPKGGIYSTSSGLGHPYLDEAMDLSQIYIDADTGGDTMIVQYKRLEEDA